MQIPSNIDIDAEITAFLCSVILFFVLMAVRNNHLAKSGKAIKRASKPKEAPKVERTAYTEHVYNMQTDKALQSAFEDEDYWQVLDCWNELKYFQQSFIHLSVVIRSMRSCNKGAFFIVTEIRNFLKAHPKVGSIGLLNDLLEPLSRSHEDSQVVDNLVKMIPSVNLTKDSRTYEILLTMHAANANYDKAQDLMMEMKTKEVSFTPRATVAVMTIGLKAGKIETVLKAFNRLKESWDVRSTWTVSMFALQSHKSDLLQQIVKLACKARRVSALSEAFKGFLLPEDVVTAMKSEFAQLSPAEISSSLQAIAKSSQTASDAVYTALAACPCSSPKPVPTPWRAQKMERADSNASTSEGSRSDSDEDASLSPCLKFSAPPGLAPVF